MDVNVIRSELKRRGFDEVRWLVAEFQAYRNGRPVCVKVFDVGDEGHPEYRYTIEASHIKELPDASGNGAESVEHAIATTHWKELDRVD